MKLWFHKLRHWEYWSAYVVYTPAFFLWVWFAIKFRSLTFYKYVNPAIKNGGLFADSKYETYKLLPKGSFPKTVLIKTGKRSDLQQIVNKYRISFPLIVKPDIGCKGIGVEKVFSMDELMAYSLTCNENYLIQETIAYPNEMGLFYCRIPGEDKGIITGITVKNFLKITGNGRDNVEALIKKIPRLEMQIPRLKGKMDLTEILPKGETRCLIPIGNHSRGTEFLDGSVLITEKLEQNFDAILKQVKGFYYGRLDIRYNTFEELERGINFSIIEVNGAKSEPAHMYDPKHSFWFGQREIFKHQQILQKIVRANLQRRVV